MASSNTYACPKQILFSPDKFPGVVLKGPCDWGITGVSAYDLRNKFEPDQVMNANPEIWAMIGTDVLAFEILDTKTRRSHPYKRVGKNYVLFERGLDAPLGIFARGNMKKMFNVYHSPSPLENVFEKILESYRFDKSFEFKESSNVAHILCVKFGVDGEPFFYIIENTATSTPGLFDGVGDVFEIPNITFVEKGERKEA